MPHSMAYLSLGANLGDRRKYIMQALEQLAKRAGTLCQKSSFYKTEPVGKKNQPWFLNCCVGLKTKLTPEKLLKVCQFIETKLGRARFVKWEPRVIDIDILFYEGETRQSPNLTLPHSEIPLRQFVLKPMVQIAPNFRHPLLKKTVKELLKECKDTSKVAPFGRINFLSSAPAEPDASRSRLLSKNRRAALAAAVRSLK